MLKSVRVDMVGQRFGALVAQRCLGRVGRRTVWEFLCDCGEVSRRTRDEIMQSTRRGGRISCGCKRLEYIADATSTHRMSKTKEHRAWSGMKNRCLNPRNRSYSRYGGRGITVCPLWVDSFEQFYADVGPAPSPNHSIDRMDVNGDYTPENVRWATRLEQSRNRRSNIHVSLEGISMLLVDAARCLGVDFGVAKRMAQRGERIKLIKESV